MTLYSVPPNQASNDLIATVLDENASLIPAPLYGYILEAAVRLRLRHDDDGALRAEIGLVRHAVGALAQLVHAGKDVTRSEILVGLMDEYRDRPAPFYRPLPTRHT